jgi:acetyl esterase/lipase
LSVIVLILLLSFSAAYPAQHSAYISGTISNAGDSRLTINGEDVAIGPGGRFAHRFDLEKPSYVVLVQKRFVSLFLEPGDSLEISVDADRFYESFQVNGGHRRINELMIRDSAQSARLHDYINNNYRTIYMSDPGEFAAIFDSLKTSFAGRLELFLRENKGVSEQFTRLHRTSILYSWAAGMLEYPDRRRQLSGDSNFWPPDGFYSFLDTLDINNPELLDIDTYGSFLKTYLDVRAERMLEENPDFQAANYRLFRAKMHILFEDFDDPVVRSEMLYSVMHPLLDEYNIKGIDDMMETFRAHCTNETYISSIDSLYNNDKDIQEQCEIQVYKTVDDVTLDAFIYRPDGSGPGENRPALAFFHGGGWALGKPEWGHWQCRHFSSLGLVCISFQYRLVEQHGATPVESIEDAKSAIRWMRIHARELGIDPNRIVASGFSAGGHIAACTVVIEKFDAPYEDMSVSSAADALMLWVTPVKIYNGKGYFHRILWGRAKVAECDVGRNIRSDMPPVIIFQGTADDQVPPEGAIEFAEDMKKLGNRCDLHIYEGQTHLGWGKNGEDVLEKMDAFLASIGFIYDAQETKQ